MGTHYVLKTIMPERITLPEGVLVLNREDPVVSGALMLNAYEPYFTSVFRSLLTSGMTVVDIGANIGYYSIIASARARKVIAFEPDTTNSGYIKKSIVANNATNITLIESGVGERNGTHTLYLDPHNKGKHSLLSHGSATDAISISMTTLDEALAELGTPKIDVIKMDIEGWEGQAFRGMSATLASHHPILLFEFAPWRIAKTGIEPIEILERLVSLGYSLSIISEEKKIREPILDIVLLTERLAKEDSYINIYASAIPTT